MDTSPLRGAASISQEVLLPNADERLVAYAHSVIQALDASARFGRGDLRDSVWKRAAVK
jgi:hypothetical protein